MSKKNYNNNNNKKKTSSLVIYDFTGLEIKNIMARNTAAGRQTWCGSRSKELTS